jgi:hypothetical protein
LTFSISSSTSTCVRQKCIPKTLMIHTTRVPSNGLATTSSSLFDFKRMKVKSSRN